MMSHHHLSLTLARPALSGPVEAKGVLYTMTGYSIARSRRRKRK